MFSWIDKGVLAGMSACVAFWFIVGSVGMTLVMWKYRERFIHLPSLTEQERADCLLNIGLWLLLVHSSWQRVITTFAFATEEWRMTKITLWSSPISLPLAMLSMMSILWWLCRDLFGPSRNRLWWTVFIMTGAWLGAGVSWRY